MGKIIIAAAILLASSTTAAAREVPAKPWLGLIEVKRVFTGAVTRHRVGRFDTRQECEAAGKALFATLPGADRGQVRMLAVPNNPYCVRLRR